MSKKDKQFVLNMVKENNVKFIRFWFTDILGVLKSFAITPSELELALEEGMGFDGSSIHGFARIDESDMIAMPDPSTFAILPWRKSEKGEYGADVLRRATFPTERPTSAIPAMPSRASSRRPPTSATPTTSVPELEYFYFKDNGPNPTPLDKGGYFDLTPLDAGSDLRRDTVFRPSRSSASRLNTATMKSPPASTRSTCATPKGSPWPTPP